MTSATIRICPLCGEPSNADWPLTMPDGTIREGGCQLCWERQVAEAWWAVFEAAGNLVRREP